jgi:signal transduction histidine kinase
MTSSRSKRSIRNVNLTRQHHYRFLGLWIVLTSCLVVTLNLVVYLYANERLTVRSLGTVFHEAYMASQHMFVWALVIETGLFIVALVFLAKLTAHRIAGPYIRLKQVFASVKDGNFDQSLKFRAYDGLEDVETEFNSMMAEIRAALASKTDKAEQKQNK